MGLSEDLISQFAKTVIAQNSKKDTNTASTLYGKAIEYNGQKYVQLDGSELLTPVETTTSVKDGDRVTVKIENHTATITGNLSDPSASGNTVTEMGTHISEFEIIIADRITADEAAIDKLSADHARFKEATVSDLEAIDANIENLQAKDVEITGKLEAVDADIKNLDAEKVSTDFLEANYATIEKLDATNADIYDLEATYGEFQELTTKNFEAVNADIKDLDTKKLSADEAELKYANIDFTNIGQAAMEYFYAHSGLIQDVKIGEATISGMLVGVTIKGNLIEAGTLVADKLVMLGEDGLYYKLNTNGMTTTAEQTEYNSLNGSIITAKSITATQISVSDLVAFDATIGGFNITDKSIFSEVKDSAGNTTRGVYFDVDGQVNFGDSEHFVKYIRDEETGEYHLTISADTILYSLNGTQRSIADLGILSEYVKIGVYEDEPCIELGELDSDFKLIITNTRIMFMEGTAVPAYISGQTLIAQNIEVKQQMTQGGFSWVTHDGNLGLVWTGPLTATVGYDIVFSDYDIGETTANIGESFDTTLIVRPRDEASMAEGAMHCSVYYGTLDGVRGAEYTNCEVVDTLIYDDSLGTYVYTANIHIPLVTGDFIIEIIYW